MDRRVGWHGALSECTRPVHLSSVDLVQSMEVKSGGLVAQLVDQVDNDRVTHRALNLGAGPLSVDTDDGPAETVRCCGNPGDIPVVSDSYGPSH